MTYNVFGGMLNLAQLHLQLFDVFCVFAFILQNSYSETSL